MYSPCQLVGNVGGDPCRNSALLNFCSFLVYSPLSPINVLTEFQVRVSCQPRSEILKPCHNFLQEFISYCQETETN